MRKLQLACFCVAALAVAAYGDSLPSTSLYVQNGLIGHLDAIENGGVGVHNNSPSEWTDLKGNQTFSCVNGSSFTTDAWVGGNSRYITASSAKALAALQNKTFTLEMVVSHPASPVGSYENWAYFGDSGQNHRYLVLDIRTPNSSTPLVQGLQYRTKAYDGNVPVPANGLTSWGKRQYLAIVCSGNTATLYCDGTNVLHTYTKNSLDPTLSTLAFGATPNGSSPLNTGAEICAVRMTERVLTGAEMLQNYFLDQVRFMGADATNGEKGYRVENGEVQVHVRIGGLGMQFSLDDGANWQDGALDFWTPFGTALGITARVKSDGSSAVSFANLPAGATVANGKVSFTAGTPENIVVSKPTDPSTALYVQTGLIGHLDAMENGGTGIHLDSPSEWTDLTGNHTFNCNNGSAFSEIAWVGNSNRYITAKSELARLALTNKAFTLEMVVSHPASPVGNFEYWTYFGANTNNHRYLTMEIRRNNSSNPVVGGLQYRSNSYKDDVAIPASTGMTAWNTRQYLAVVCNGNTATLYCDGTNVLHRFTNNAREPSLPDITFGASPDATGLLNVGAEISAIRMTKRVLTNAEIQRNNFIDRVRFMGASATDGELGYRISDGALQVRTHVGGLGVQFSTDGGATWQNDALDVWTSIGAAVTFTARLTADGSSNVFFDALPGGATVSGGTVSLTADAPARIVARTPVSPATSLYVQDGLIGHLDAIENGGVGVHNAAPSQWTDLTGNHTFTCVNGADFASDAWIANGSRHVVSSSPLPLGALKNRAFTLEMVIMHPESPISPTGYEKWAVFGADSNRMLMLEIRTMNSQNPVVQGLQYRSNGYDHACEIPNGRGTTTQWGRRHCLSITCDGTSATLYLDATNALHTSSYGLIEPAMTAFAFGAYANGSSPLSEGAEICSVRMTKRVLSEGERLRNRFLDGARFLGESATDGSRGYRISNGEIQVFVSAACAGAEFSSDDGATWHDNAITMWAALGGTVSLSYRVKNGTPTQRVLFDRIPEGVGDIGGRLTFKSSVPLNLTGRIACRPATSYYVQNGLIGHLDAIENGGAGVHAAAPSTWTDLTGNHTFMCGNGSSFAESAWIGNGSRYITSTSQRSLDALNNKAFTLEMMIAHPEMDTTIATWEFWSFFGDNDHRQLTTEIRTGNSQNPLIGGNQYRANGYNVGCEIPNGNGKTTSWNKRHYLAVTCVGTNAILYCDGTNALHVSNYGTTEPNSTAVTFGANSTYGDVVKAGAEICSVRMTERVLTGDEIMRNRFLDAARFSAELPDASCGYKLRESDGALLVNVTAPAVQDEHCTLSYSINGGEWTETLDGWVVADSETTVRVRSSDRHYGPTWKSKTLTPAAPVALSVEIVELPPQGTVIILK